MSDDFAAIRLGDEAAYEALFRCWYKPLCRFAYHHTQNAADAEDIVQSIFADLWIRRESLAPLRFPVKQFLFGAVRNCGINAIRHRSYVATRLPFLLESVYGPDVRRQLVAPPASLAAEVREIGHAIDQAVEQLTPALRRVFRECVAGGRDQVSVAAELKVSVKAVEVNSRRARLDLRRLLAAHAP